MTRSEIAVCVCVICSIAGCASTTAQDQDKLALISYLKAHNSDPKNKDNKFICREEIPTGTNIPLVVCRKKKDIENRERRDQMEFLRYTRTARGQ